MIEKLPTSQRKPNTPALIPGKSRHGYPSKYAKKNIEEQVKILKGMFPELTSFDEKASKEDFPPNTEGLFAIPQWKLIAPTYKKACKRVFDMIKETRNGRFFNYRMGKLGLKHLRQTEKSIKMFKGIANEQKNSDILIVAAQFGFRYRGYSSNAAENMMIPGHECGLGTFAVGIMLLTHPERLQNCNDLWINCSGDQFNNGDGRFDYVPYFIFHVSGVEFGMHEYNREHAHWGTASAAVWQSL